MAIKPNEFTKPNKYDPNDPIYEGLDEITNETLFDALQGLTGAIQTQQGVQVPNNVDIQSESITVDRYSTYVNTAGTLSSINVAVINNGDAILSGGVVEIVLPSGTTVVNSQNNNGIQTLTNANIITDDVYILVLMRNGEKWQEIPNANASVSTIKKLAQNAVQSTGDTMTGTLVVSHSEFIEIGTLAELIAFRDRVNNGETLNAKLTADIDLEGSQENPWTSIGTLGYPYKAIFDGGNHTISNLYIAAANNNSGLFNNVTNNGVIKNLKVKDVILNAIYGCGIIVTNVTEGSIINVHVSNATIVGSGSAGFSAGAIVGEFYGNMYASSASNIVITAEDNNATVGGIAGAVGRYDNIVGRSNIVATYVDNVTIITNGINASVGGIVGFLNYGTLSDNYYVADADIGTNPTGVTRVTTIQALNDNVPTLNDALTYTPYQYETGVPTATALPTVVEKAHIDTQALALNGRPTGVEVLEFTYEDDTTTEIDFVVLK